MIYRIEISWNRVLLGFHLKNQVVHIQLRITLAHFWYDLDFYDIYTYLP